MVIIKPYFRKSVIHDKIEISFISEIYIYYLNSVWFAVFGHRAKLYRYDNATKEWKERGVGEMKILYHAGHGSYRLLLRREQVHKIVCNFLLTPDVEFRPLSTSDQAWMWAGINYIEQEACAEQLAIKFKSSDVARQFKAHIDKIQQELREKKNTQGNNYNNL